MISGSPPFEPVGGGGCVGTGVGLGDELLADDVGGIMMPGSKPVGPMISGIKPPVPSRG